MNAIAAHLAAHLADHWDAWLTGGVLAAVIAAILRGRYGPDLIFMGAVAALLVATGAAAALPASWGLSPGPLTAVQAIDAFAAKTVVTVGMLYVVAEGMRQTGAMSWLIARLLGRPRGALSAQLRLTVPVAGLSAFINNTPIVAMFLPVLDSAARRSGVAASKLFMPLSYASILGGVCTLIGTSTNIVVADLLADRAIVVDGRLLEINMFTLSWIGLPCALAGLLYMTLFGRRLLPDRKPPSPPASGVDPASTEASAQREYTAAMKVAPGSPMAGKTVDGAGLRHLPGLFLSRIDRGNLSIVAVGPGERIAEGDDLVFVGDLDAVVELQQMRGLIPEGQSPRERIGSGYRPGLRLAEVVVSSTGSLAGQTIRQSRFRTTFGAVIVAVHRAGQRLEGRLGDIRLRAGDVLLLEAPPGFGARYRDSREFYMVQEREEAASLRHDRAIPALAILVVLVASITTGVLTPMVAATGAAAAMVACRCCTGPEARRSVSWTVLLVIAAAFAVASAMDRSGLAGAIAGGVTAAAGPLGPTALLAAVYVTTMALTMTMTHNAAAALMFPLALAVAQGAGLNPMPFAVTVAIAASCEFVSPVGYQTNLMVMGPGGYRPLDFARFGAPLNLMCGAITIALAPVFYGGLVL